MIVYDGVDVIDIANLHETSNDVSRPLESHLGKAIFGLITVTVSFALGYIFGKQAGKKQSDLEHCDNRKYSKYYHNECAGCSMCFDMYSTNLDRHDD